MTRASPVALHGANRQVDTMIGMTSEAALREVVKDGDRLQSRGRTATHSHREEIISESQPVATHPGISLPENHPEARK